MKQFTILLTLISLVLWLSAAMINGTSITASPCNTSIESVISEYQIQAQKTGYSTDIQEKTGNELAVSLYPNPVTSIATINYTLPIGGQVTIQIYNSIGLVVNTVVKEFKSTGKYSLNADVSSLPHGIYLARIRVHGAGLELVHTIKFIVNR